MRRTWLQTGFATLLIVAGGLSWAQPSIDEAALQRGADAVGKALSKCLSTQIRRLANDKTPTQADGDAAAKMCAPEEEAFRNFLLKMPGLEKGVIPSGAYAGISVDLIVLCTRQHTIWGMVGFDERHLRDESVPLYQVEPRCR